MELNIDTSGSSSSADLRFHFGVKGICKAVVTHYRSNRISSIFLNTVTVKSGDRFFHQLALLVSDAVQKIDDADKYKTMQELSTKNGSQVNLTC